MWWDVLFKYDGESSRAAEIRTGRYWPRNIGSDWSECGNQEQYTGEWRQNSPNNLHHSSLETTIWAQELYDASEVFHL